MFFVIDHIKVTKKKTSCRSLPFSANDERISPTNGHNERTIPETPEHKMNRKRRISTTPDTDGNRTTNETSNSNVVRQTPISKMHKLNGENDDCFRLYFDF